MNDIQNKSGSFPVPVKVEPAFLVLRRDVLKELKPEQNLQPEKLRLDAIISGEKFSLLPVKPGTKNQLVIGRSQLSEFKGLTAETKAVIYLDHRSTHCTIAVVAHRPYLSAGPAGQNWLNRHHPIFCTTEAVPGIVLTALPVRQNKQGTLQLVLSADLARALGITPDTNVNLHYQEQTDNKYKTEKKEVRWITEAEIRSAWKNKKTIHVDSTQKLTPGARQLARELKVLQK